MSNRLNIGIVGAGGFAAFASKAFLQIPGIRIAAIMDSNEAAAEILAKEVKASVYLDLSLLLADKEIDLVYIATPPFLHYQQSKMALQAGKHVICEKPAALKTSEAEALQALAKEMDLLYVVNLMQRYNPLYDIVKKIVEQKLLGEFLHGFFENYASDENLQADHWFWEEDKSGGIFIEHGVHFFDMFSGWLGQGKLLNAVQLQRPHSTHKIMDRVQATVLYDKGLVNFYHGFDQPIVLDRQEMRLQFERGEITLYGWVPVKMVLHGLFTNDALMAVSNLMDKCSVIITDEGSEEIKKVKGRFTEIVFDKEATIEYGNLNNKSKRYAEILTAMLTDQWAWIKDRSHKRVIDDNNAVESLRIAEQAANTKAY